MDLEIKGRVAVVAGSSHWLGLSAAKNLMCEGANVVICARNYEALFPAKTELDNLKGGKVEAVATDIHSDDQRKRFSSKHIWQH